MLQCFFSLRVTIKVICVTNVLMTSKYYVLAQLGSELHVTSKENWKGRLTARSKVLLDKLMVTQIVRKCPAFYRAPKDGFLFVGLQPKPIWPSPRQFHQSNPICVYISQLVPFLQVFWPNLYCTFKPDFKFDQLIWNYSSSIYLFSYFV
jgi:hypothetical protein